VPWLEDSGHGDGKYQTFGDQDPTSLGRVPTRKGKKTGWSDGLN
jgi:hypothetical protein